MNESQINPSEAVIVDFANQHNAMLKACCQIAELDLPAIVRTLEQALLNSGNVSLEPAQADARERLKENISVARLALEIHREVKRQLRARRGVAWQ